MPEGRAAEVWGSVAVGYGRIYFTTEEGLYASAGRARRSRPRRSAEAAAGAGARGRTPRPRGCWWCPAR